MSDRMPFRIGLGVLTYNVLDNERVELLYGTLDSLQRAFPQADRFIVDNGSTDGTLDVVHSIRAERPTMSWQILRTVGPNHVPAVGLNRLMRFLAGPISYDVVVLSDDDMVWREDAAMKLQRFVEAMPEDVALVSGYLEPEWDWNTVRGVVDAGGERALWRDNAPGCAWVFRQRDWPLFGPLDESGLGQDVKACQKLIAQGKRVVQLELADHVGWGKSTIGNYADKFAKPLDRAKWGLT